MSDTPIYWLPEWWGWMQDWGDCLACLKYNHSPCTSCEIPPGVLGLAQLVGGGTVAVAGSMRGNVGITSQQQAQAAARQHGAQAVQKQLQKQQQAIERQGQQLNLNINGSGGRR